MIKKSLNPRDQNLTLGHFKIFLRKKIEKCKKGDKITRFGGISVISCYKNKVKRIDR
jgi:hypothetical protein